MKSFEHTKGSFYTASQAIAARQSAAFFKVVIALFLSFLLAFTPGLAFAIQAGTGEIATQSAIDDSTELSEGSLNEDESSNGSEATSSASIVASGALEAGSSNEISALEGAEGQDESVSFGISDEPFSLGGNDNNAAASTSEPSEDSLESTISANSNSSANEGDSAAAEEGSSATSESADDQQLSTQAASSEPNKIEVIYDKPIRCGKDVKTKFTFEMKNATDLSKVKYHVDRISVQMSSGGTTAYVDDYINSDKNYTKDPFEYSFLASGWYRIYVSAIEDNNNQKIGSDHLDFYVGVSQSNPLAEPYKTVNEQAEQYAQGILDNLPTDPAILTKKEEDYTKVLGAHDYFITSGAKLNEKSCYVGPTGAFLRGEGTSESFHQAMALLLNYLNIPTSRAAADGKVWTLAKVGSDWTHVDVAADTVQPEGLKKVYLGATDAQIKRLRPAYTPGNIKATNYELNFYFFWPNVSTWLPTVKSKIETQFKAGKTVFTVASDSSWTNPGVNAIVLDCLASYLSERSDSTTGQPFFYQYTGEKRPIISFAYTGSTTKGSGYFKVSTRDLGSSYLSVAAISNQTYTGSAIKPEPTVTLNGTVLRKNIDYIMSYSKNISTGTATITFTGKGTYIGKATRTFKIVAAPLSSATVSGLVSKTYTGSKITQNVTLKHKNKTLTSSDYSVAYSNNINAGTATVTLTGKGNYTGTVKKTFKINRASLSSVTVSGLTNKWYTGSKVTQNLVLKRGNTTLTSKDYTVSYSNNTKIGTATVTVTGKGNYTGTRQGTFTISKGLLSQATISGIVDKPYTGKKVTQSMTIKLGGRTLTLSDYSVSYSNNTKIGTATMTITGKGNYTGTVKKTFKIKTSFLNSKITASNMTQMATGAALAPSVTVKLGKTTLKRGTDYYLTYNGSTTTPKKAGTYTVRAVGKGKYAGTKTVGTYKLVKAPAVSFSSSKVYTICSASNSNFVLDAAGKSPKIGANVSIWTKNGGKNQKWYLIPDGNGYYYIKSASNKTFVLDAAGKTPKIGANISIWKNNGGKNQKWKIEKQLDGTYIIRSASNSNFVLDAAGKSPKIGANVSIWTSNGGKNQRWYIKAA